MRAVRRRDSGPEVALRRELHRRGLRYRVDVSLGLRGLERRRVDIAFTRARVAVHVDGCFWHGCPVHGTAAKANSAFWQDKIETNRLRDQQTDAALDAAGWVAARVWEHEVRNQLREVADRIEDVVRGRSGGPPRRS